ncbi:DinB family protein [Paenibacillus alkalitolerans]|uniref:DinB family protein n=1 Tax=Paenibacillus alkalitolerans TaxID=2799335 RepID=UPI0018F66E8F|nr:DinB family protein [Paenibacillus alkalitolerans]
MDKKAFLLHGWDICYDKEDWYPPLAEALKGVTAEQANWKPEGASINTIWENVQHLMFYKERFLKRLTGEEKEFPQGITNDDTFAAASADPSAWEETVRKMDEIHKSIRGIIVGYGDDDLEREIPKRPVGTSLFSLILHDAYHTGQIIQIRKLQGSWPSNRSYE